MSATIKRGTARRPTQQQRRKPAQPSIVDRALTALPVSEATLRRIATWSIMGVTCAGALAVATWFGLPGAVGTALGEGIGDAGFRVSNIQVSGLNRMDHNVIYQTVLGQKSKAMPLVDLEGIRRELVAHGGWIEDAHVSRRLPDTLIVHVVERTPSAVWQNHGKLALIAANGTWLEPVDPEAMPDLPLVIGAHANEQEPAYRQLLDAAPALRPLVKAATWVGNRRWTLTFESGETLMLPEGEAIAAKTLVKFARSDAIAPLLGKGWVNFDYRNPETLYARKPGVTTNKAITDPNAGPTADGTAPAKAAQIEAKQAAGAAQG